MTAAGFTVAVIVALFGIAALAIPLFAIAGHLQGLRDLIYAQNSHYDVGGTRRAAVTGSTGPTGVRDPDAPWPPERRDPYPRFSEDWHALEDLLNKVSAGAADPIYSESEAAKAALFRICDAASAPFDSKGSRDG